MTASATRTPTVLYAQDKKHIFMTIDLQDVKAHTLETLGESVSFKTLKEGQNFEFSLPLYGAVKPDVSAVLSLFCPCFVLVLLLFVSLLRVVVGSLFR